MLRLQEQATRVLLLNEKEEIVAIIRPTETGVRIESDLIENRIDLVAIAPQEPVAIVVNLLRSKYVLAGRTEP